MRPSVTSLLVVMLLGRTAAFLGGFRRAARAPLRQHVRSLASVASEVAAAAGDLVAVSYSLTTADGEQLPDASQVFDQGTVKLVVDDGGFVPCLHAAVKGMAAGEKVSTVVSPSEAFGESNPDMGPVEIPKGAAPDGIETGMMVRLVTGATARVTAVTDETVTIDANGPMAGVSLQLDAEVLSVEPGATSLQLADFAIGCFWGAELAFQREKGVVTTKVG